MASGLERLRPLASSAIRLCESGTLDRMPVSAEASPAAGGASEHNEAEWEAFQAHQRNAARLPHAEEARVLFATAGCAALPAR